MLKPPFFAKHPVDGGDPSYFFKTSPTPRTALEARVTI